MGVLNVCGASGTAMMPRCLIRKTTQSRTKSYVDDETGGIQIDREPSPKTVVK